MEQRSISLSRGGQMLHGVSPEHNEWDQHDKDGVSLGCHPEQSEGSLSISFQFDDSTNFLRCHPERSEGSLSRGTQMLRGAQHDRAGTHTYAWINGFMCIIGPYTPLSTTTPYTPRFCLFRKPLHNCPPRSRIHTHQIRTKPIRITLCIKQPNNRIQ